MAWTVVLLIAAVVVVGPLAAKEYVEQPSYDVDVDDLSINNTELISTNELDFDDENSIEDRSELRLGRSKDPPWCLFVGIAGCQETYIKTQCGHLCTPKRGCSESRGFTKLPGSNRCFMVYTDMERDWYQTMKKCRDEGLIMVKTSDADAVIIRDGLVDKYGDEGGKVWLDAKYNGAQYVWNDGEYIANDNRLWYPGGHDGTQPKMPELKPDYCMLLLNTGSWKNPNPLTPYWTTPCSETKYGRKAFCELV